MKKLMAKLKEILSKEDSKCYFIIIMLALMVCSLLFIGYPQGQDTIYHISRTVGTEIALKEGQILPLIASNFVNDFGYSWNLFYPPLPNYIMMIIKLVSHSYVKALNILIFLTVALSGIFMFSFMKKVTKSSKIALLASILYMLAPYRLVDIYIRGALGEVMAFMFLPLVFNGLYNILEDNGKRHYLLSIGAIGLLLSHNISTLLVIMSCAVYIIINIKKVFKKEVIKYLLINAGFILAIVMFFYGPMLQNKMYTDYAVFNELKGSSAGLHDHSVYVYQLLFGKMQYEWSYSLNDPNSQNLDMCFAVGLTLIIPILFTPFIYKKIDKNKRKIYVTTLAIGLLFLILTTTIILWDKLPNFIAFIQYTYRFLLISTFFLSIIAAVNLDKLSEKLDMKTIMIYTMIALMYITPLLQAAPIIKGLDWKEFYSTEKMEEEQRFSSYCATYEYLPSKAFNNKNYIAKRSQEPIIKSGNCEISQSQKDKLDITFEVKNVSEETKIELPFIYYLGYRADIDGEELQTTESENGFVEITIPEGKEGKAEIKYCGTKLYYTSLAVSIIGFIIFLIYIIMYERKIYSIKIRKENICQK